MQPRVLTLEIREYLLRTLLNLNESQVPTEPNEALQRISQDMTRVFERLTAPKSPIDMVRRYGAEEFHGTNMEESDKEEFWLEKLQRILEEV